MKKVILSLAIVAVLSTGVVYAATKNYRVKSGDTWQSIADQNGVSLADLVGQNQPARGATIKIPVPDVPPTPPTPPSGSEIVFKAFVTSYTWWDNTPPGTADIALPVLHSKAGGTGTYADPITIAVGHSITNGVSTPDYPKGTKFYIPNVRRYFIVEDVCGDGSKPQNGPCHTGYQQYAGATAWIDMWIDGQSVTKTAANNCANALTNVFTVIQNPASNYAVVSGPVIQNGACSAQYGNTIVTQ